VTPEHRRTVARENVAGDYSVDETHHCTAPPEASTMVTLSLQFTSAHILVDVAQYDEPHDALGDEHGVHHAYLAVSIGVPADSSAPG